MKKFHLSMQVVVGVCLLLLVGSVIVTSNVLAKYTQTVKNNSSPVTAKSFYFESDYLTSDSHTYKLNAGTSSVSFDLYNYENELRISEVDCMYTIVVESSDASFTIDGENATEKELSASADEKADHTVTLGNLKDGYSYTVTVTANGGYVKTLSAIFTVAPAHSGFFMNTDQNNEHYVLLTVWTEDVTGNVTVTVPSGLIPDATDPMLASVVNYEGGTYKSFTFTDTDSFGSGFSSRSYRFFKTASYDPDSTFTVKIGETNALESSIS